MALVLGSCGEPFGSVAIPGQGKRTQRRPKGWLSWTKMFKENNPEKVRYSRSSWFVSVWYGCWNPNLCQALWAKTECRDVPLPPLHWYQVVSKYFSRVIGACNMTSRLASQFLMNHSIMKTHMFKYQKDQTSTFSIILCLKRLNYQTSHSSQKFSPPYYVCFFSGCHISSNLDFAKVQVYKGRRVAGPHR